MIPSELREGLREGEKLLIIKNGRQLVLKKASELDKKLKEDIEFARRTEKAWKEYEQGKFRRMSFDEFLIEARKW